MLRFKSSNDHQLFWMQEPAAEKDDEYCKKVCWQSSSRKLSAVIFQVNELLNNPPARSRAGGSDRSNAANAAAANNPISALNTAIAGGEDMSALGNMDQNQLMQLFSLMNGSNADIFGVPGMNIAQNESVFFWACEKELQTIFCISFSAGVASADASKARKESSAGATGGSAEGGNKFDAALLNQIISQLPATSAGGGSSKRQTVELCKILSRINVDAEAKAHADELAPHLPTTSKEKEINYTIGSPQFQQAVDFFGYALQSGQLGEALRHFKLAENVVKAADKGGEHFDAHPPFAIELRF